MRTEGSLIARRQASTGNDASRSTASLFQKAPDSGFFKPRSQSSMRAARRASVQAAVVTNQRRGPKLAAKPNQLDRLRQLIESAESRKDGYDAVQHRAKIRPAKMPTQMTLFEIYTWIDNTPGQPHAIGRYQFIPATLRRLVKRLDLPLGTRFTPTIQDRLADILLAEAGLNRLQSDEITREAFMKNLAKIWAGFPTSTGKSYYDGYAGNSASITWAAFDREMGKIFPTKTPS